MTLSPNSYLETDDIGGFDFIWQPSNRERAEELSKKYGTRVRIWSRYVLQGGANDMYEFTNKYQSRFRYTKLRKWDNRDREEYYNQTRQNMQKIAGTESFSFLYCPFMKRRAMELVENDTDPDSLSTILCYILWGENKDEFVPSTSAKRRYLKQMGVF